MGVSCGFRGDFARGSLRSVGLPAPTELSVSALLGSLGMNHNINSFRLNVNQFGTHLARKLVDRVRDQPRYADVSIIVDGRADFGRDEWLLEPMEGG